MKKTKSILASMATLFLILAMGSCNHQNTNAELIFKSEEINFKLEKVADSVRVPFGMTFLPNGKMLVSNRFAGELVLIDLDSGKKKILKGVPASYCKGDGGALDVLPHPDFEENNWLYFSHSIGDSTLSTMVVDRAVLRGDSLSRIERLFTAFPYYKSPSHYGSRMAIKDGYLFFTMGDRYDLKDSAQTVTNHLGKVMRIFEDGRIPKDNPFVSIENAKQEIWSIGHRNPQGLTFRPNTDELWVHEHGPKGGDELNRITPGYNYGWPVICHGIDYDDTPIGDGITHKEGLEQPVHYYTPSIAPSGMDFYTGDSFKAWQGNLFIGAMAKTHLNRLVIEEGKVVHEERILQDFGKRIRVVREGPDGLLYIGVDGGMILRLVPMES